MLKFNSDDAKHLISSLGDYKSIYNYEGEQVQRHWQNLERTWYDYCHDEFSVKFEPILRSYRDNIEQINRYILQLERFTGVTEAIQDSLYDISSSSLNSTRSNSLTNPVNTAALNPDPEAPIIPLEILPIILLLALLIYDAKIIYIDDENLRMSDLRENPASDRYTKPMSQPLGDVGEKVVLDMLREELGPINSEKIQIKKKLESNLTQIPQEPDFYIPKDGAFPPTIVDAKAWKSFNYKSAMAVINKYAGLTCLSEGGEIRLYFPSSVFDNAKMSEVSPIAKVLEKIPKNIGNIAIKILPMKESYSALKSHTAIIKMIFQMFRMHDTR